jgi:uncharacterized protein (DUF983 family)
MSAKKKGTMLGAMFNHKCPKCREGDLFDTGAFSFQKPFQMPERCSKCGQSYFPEPGFYYGAMFMSYIITSFFSLGLVGICILVFDLSVKASFGILIAVLAILFVWFFRTARSVWIGLTVKYDPAAIVRFEQANTAKGSS